MSREAMKLALEALVQLDGIDTETECVTIDVDDVITALRQALDVNMTKLEAWKAWCESAGTPDLATEFTLEQSSHGKAFSFAWESGFIEGMQRQMRLSVEKALEEQQEPSVDVRAWFTIDEINAWADKKLKENPQWAAQPSQQPLTDKQIFEIWEEAMVKDNGKYARLDNQPFVHFARAIERAHGIKEKNT